MTPRDPAGTRPVALRPATAGDRTFLLRLFRSVRGDRFAMLDLPAPERDALVEQQFVAQGRDYRSRFPSSDHRIVEVAGQPVGRIWVDRREEEIRLLDIALLPAHRNLGIGTTLLAGLQAEGRSAGVPLGHAVDNDNDAGLRFYARLGFEVAGPLGHSHTLMRWRP